MSINMAYDRIDTNDGAAQAADAGLRWVNDSEPGWHLDADRAARDAAGRRVRADAQARVKALAIPPAWTDVWICADPHGHIQATGRDARGRKQYRYHDQWQAHRGAVKFDQLLAFAQALPRLRRRVQRVLDDAARARTPPGRDAVVATLVRLLDATQLRIGNDAYARENRSYGLSTLRTRHARLQGGNLTLSFVGKGGVRQQAALADRRVARIVRRCMDLPGQELFQYVDEGGRPHAVTSTDVNAWLAEAAGPGITAKVFRTWHGSVCALERLLQACRPGAERCGIQDVLKATAQRLGNTPAVCRKSYIHPDVLALVSRLGDEATRSELVAECWASSPPQRTGLSAAEGRLQALLRRGRVAARQRPGAPAAARKSDPHAPRRTAHGARRQPPASAAVRPPP